MSKPFALVQIDDTVRHLRNTMRKADHHIPKSMARQLPAMLSAYLRQRLRGDTYIHPGMAKMGKWGECSERQARENFKRLRFYHVVFVTEYAKGGRRAARFTMSVDAIVQYLTVAKANPSPELIEKLRSFRQNPEENPEVGGAENPAEKPEATSDGIHIEEATVSEGGEVITFPVQRTAGGGA